MEKNMTCPRCGATNPADAAVCASCGLPLSDDKGVENPAAKFPSLEAYCASHVLTDAATADDVLGDYAEEALSSLAGNRQLIHRDAARKQVLAWFLFAVVAFLDISGMMFYHRNWAIFIAILGVAVLALYLTRKKVGNKAALVRKLAAMPDADIGNVLMSEYDSMVSSLGVNIAKAAIIAALVLSLGILYAKPHMIFENNATGCGVRFYTLGIFNEPDVVIPETHNGKPVTEIRGNVFQDLAHIRTVRLPSHITQIRGNTFEGCSGLTSIDIPAGVTRIGGHAFYGCSSLSSVTIPDSMREIGSSAFRRCYSLRTIRIPQACGVNSKAFKESPTRVERY